MLRSEKLQILLQVQERKVRETRVQEIFFDLAFSTGKFSKRMNFGMLFCHLPHEFRFVGGHVSNIQLV